MNKYKSILINEELHKQLKMYAVSHGSSIVTLAENAIGNLINQKASSVTPVIKGGYFNNSTKPAQPIVDKTKWGTGSPTTLKATPSIDRKENIPFD